MDDIRLAIKESNAIEDVYDEASIDQAMLAMDFLMKTDFDKLGHGVILKTHKILMNNQPLQPHERGYYRDLSKTNVTVGGRMPPHYIMVTHLMSNWLLDYQERDAQINHVSFEKIHPFVDGNGRVGRLLYYWQLIKQGNFSKEKIIYENDKFNYYRWFR